MKKSKRGGGKSKRTGEIAVKGKRATAGRAMGQPAGDNPQKGSRTRSQAVLGHVSARGRRQQARRDSR